MGAASRSHFFFSIRTRKISNLFFTHVYRVCHLPAVGYKRLDNDVTTDQAFACMKWRSSLTN
jgi:hypothetical protein